MTGATKQPVLTKRQQEVLLFVHRYRRRNGISPRFQDIGDALGVTKVSIAERLDALELAGAIKREPFLARSVRITRAGYACLPAAALTDEKPPVEEVLREAWECTKDEHRMAFYIQAVEPWLATQGDAQA